MGPGRTPSGPQAGNDEEVWALKGERPLARVHHRYKWTYLYSFVRPSSREVHWLILPALNSAEVFSLALSHSAEQVGASKDKRILLVVLDKAGWHTGPRVKVAESIHTSSSWLPIPRAATLREAVAANQRGGSQPLL